MMKMTLVGTPKQIVEQDRYMAFEMTAKVPTTLPKGLPRSRQSPSPGFAWWRRSGGRRSRRA
jgi:hypothetical protein